MENFHPFPIKDVGQCGRSKQFRMVGDLLADAVPRFFPAFVPEDGGVIEYGSDPELRRVSLLVA